MESKNYLVLAYYHFVFIEDPEKEVLRHKEFFAGRDVTCRIYISHQGINGQMSAFGPDAEAYMQWLHGDQRFAGVDFKIHHAKENVFPRVTVKVRSQIVALDEEVDTADGGKHLSPQEWCEMLETKDTDTILLDVRNDYEWKIGHFEGSTLPALETFREFPKWVDELKDRVDPKKTKVMMYCTGGIRCELFSAVMKKRGFDTVYQLQGGVIGYGLRKGSDHWQGKLFVFDDRLAVPIVEEERVEAISQCVHCAAPCDTYYNCANMDCNELFLCCPECAARWKGCCCASCQSASRLRCFVPEEHPKPFRRSHLCTLN